MLRLSELAGTRASATLGLAIHLDGLPAAGGEAVLWGMDYRELILQYADSLRTDLTWASKTHINMLTMLAAENKAAAASICAAIERHILSVIFRKSDPASSLFLCVSQKLAVLQQAPTASKLPTLYLVDSIVKNVKEPYIGLFCRNLAQVRFFL